MAPPVVVAAWSIAFVLLNLSLIFSIAYYRNLFSISIGDGTAEAERRGQSKGMMYLLLKSSIKKRKKKTYRGS